VELLRGDRWLVEERGDTALGEMQMVARGDSILIGRWENDLHRSSTVGILSKGLAIPRVLQCSEACLRPQ